MTSGWQKYPSKSSGRTRRAEWQRIRKTVLKRDNYECQLRYPGCLTEATAVDHIIPASQGGPDHPDNCAAVCGPCHAKKTASEAAAGRNRGKRPPRKHPSDYLSADYFGDHPGIKR